MKVVHLNTTDQGGSYKAVERIHKGMLIAGIDSEILLRTKFNPENTGIEVIDTPIKKFVSKTKNALNIIRSSGEIISDYYGTNVLSHPIVRDADIVFVHWCNSFISYAGISKLVKSGKKVYIVSHDMWYSTGGCHLDGYCGGYKDGCIECPKLAKHPLRKKMAARNFEIKKKAYRGTYFIGPSKWMYEVASHSDIWNSIDKYWIHNPVDYAVYHYMSNKIELREKYNIPVDKKIILYGANKALDDENKGAPDLTQIITKLDIREYALVIFGNARGTKIKNCGLDVIYLGYVTSERVMAELYNVSDVFLNLSHQESFCYTVAESLACGTPVVAYSVGGICEQVSHLKNGYLVKLGDNESIVYGIDYCLDNLNKIIKPVLINDLDNIGKKYIDLL